MSIDMNTASSISPLKLNLGCRNEILEDYINIDIDKLNIYDKNDQIKPVVIQMNAMDIDRYFIVGSVDKIIARHFFEHLSHEEITILLYKIWSILKTNGELYIAVPDFQRILEHYVAEHKMQNFANVDVLHSRLFGIADESLHKTVWTSEIGVFYLTRENFFVLDSIEKVEDELELRFYCHKQ